MQCTPGPPQTVTILPTPQINTGKPRYYGVGDQQGELSDLTFPGQLQVQLEEMDFCKTILVKNLLSYPSRRKEGFPPSLATAYQ